MSDLIVCLNNCLLSGAATQNGWGVELDWVARDHKYKSQLPCFAKTPAEYPYKNQWTIKPIIKKNPDLCLQLTNRLTLLVQFTIGKSKTLAQVMSFRHLAAREIPIVSHEGTYKSYHEMALYRVRPLDYQSEYCLIWMAIVVRFFIVSNKNLLIGNTGEWAWDLLYTDCLTPSPSSAGAILTTLLFILPLPHQYLSQPNQWFLPLVSDKIAITTPKCF